MNLQSTTPAAVEARPIVYELSANQDGSDLHLITLTLVEFQELIRRVNELRGLPSQAKYVYSASKGGHAPGYLREALADCLLSGEEPWYKPLAEEGAVDFAEAEQLDWWASLSLEDRRDWLLGQLWNCTDIAGSLLCSEVELPKGSSTYASIVRKLKADL